MRDQARYPKAEGLRPRPQTYPGREADMDPRPVSDLANYKAAGKLVGRVALVTGGDSGIGRAVAVAFAKEGADVAVVYNLSDGDAEDTRTMVEACGRRCLLVKADVSTAAACRRAVVETVQQLGGLNVLVNNAATGMEQAGLEDITEEQVRRVFDTNILSHFFLAQAALPHLEAGDSIIGTGSVGGVYGAARFIDYSATKGAVHAFTKALALNLGPKGIRVNCVVPGPFWTPLQEAMNKPETTRAYPAGAAKISAAGRSGQPEEIAPLYVHLAADESSYTSGTLVEVHGGWVGWPS